MNSSIREALERLFRQFPVLLAGSTPSESEVVAVETQLGRRLDPSHRDFVLRYGGALVGSVPIIGLRESETMGHGLLADVNSRFRSEPWPHVRDWVVFSVDLAGNPIGYDTNGVVWSWDHDAGATCRLADTFEGFLEGCLPACAKG
jgi:hypothetical protein